jgi:hypothetical protein
MSSVSPERLLPPFLRMPSPWPVFAVSALAATSSERRVAVVDSQQWVVDALEARDYYLSPSSKRTSSAPRMLRDSINLATRNAIRKGLLPRDGVIIVERFTEPAREFRNKAGVHAGRHVHWTECLSIVSVWAWFAEYVLSEQIGAPNHDQLLSIISIATHVERTAERSDEQATAPISRRDDAPRNIALARPLPLALPITFELATIVHASVESTELVGPGGDRQDPDDGVWVLLGGSTDNLDDSDSSEPNHRSPRAAASRSAGCRAAGRASGRSRSASPRWGVRQGALGACTPRPTSFLRYRTRGGRGRLDAHPAPPRA